MENKTGINIKAIIQWVLAALYLLIAFAWLPELSGWLFLLGVLIILPLKPLEDFWEKHKIAFKLRIIAIAAILLGCIIAFLITRGYW